MVAWALCRQVDGVRPAKRVQAAINRANQDASTRGRRCAAELHSCANGARISRGGMAA
jgi:hypothetical protein